MGVARQIGAMEIVDSKVRVKDTAQWSANLRAAVAEISDGREGVRIKFHSKPKDGVIGRRVVDS